MNVEQTKKELDKLDKRISALIKKKADLIDNCNLKANSKPAFIEWTISQLKAWRETFSDVELDENYEDTNLKGWNNISNLINKLDGRNKLNELEYQEILFHLWQYLVFKED